MNKLCTTLRNGIYALCTVGFLTLTSPAQSVPVNVVGGQLLGATGININGTLFDVEFLDGTCVAVFDGCDANTDFQFQTQSDAILAAQALLDNVFNADHLLFDNFPQFTNGIEQGISSQGLILIPYATVSISFIAEGAFNVQETTTHIMDEVFSFVDSVDRDFALEPAITFAKFTAAPMSVVPLPPAGILFGSGLIFLAALCRTARKRAQA